MQYRIAFERRAAFIHATVTGRNSSGAVSAYLRDVREECIRQDCFRVLIEERLDGPRLPVGEVFSIASEGAMRALGVFEAVAYVDEEMGQMAEFAETVAVNRGMPVRTFPTVDSAEEWLLAREDDCNAMDIFMNREGQKA